jgi:hypothetical protein
MNGYQVEIDSRPDGTWNVTVYDSKGAPRMRFVGLSNTDARHTYNLWLGKLRTGQDTLDFPDDGHKE